MAKKRQTKFNMGNIELPVGTMPVFLDVDIVGITIGDTFANGSLPSEVSIPGIRGKYRGFFGVWLRPNGVIPPGDHRINNSLHKQQAKAANGVPANGWTCLVPPKHKQVMLDLCYPVIEQWVEDHRPELVRHIMTFKLEGLRKYAASQRKQADTRRATHLANAVEAEETIAQYEKTLEELS